MLTFKRKLILTQAQANRLDSWIGVARMVYNMCLEIRKEAYKNQQTTIHRFELDGQLKTIRDIDWVADVPFDALSDAIKRMDLAYRKFFSGGGFPKWATKRKYASIKVRHNISIKDRYIKLPKIGLLKMVKDSPVIGKIKTVIVKKEVHGYFVCITTDAVKQIQNQDENQILGIDMGIARLFTDSNGVHSENPRHLKKYEDRLRIENRSLSRKSRGGKNWVKQVIKLRRLYVKISSVRADYLHKESTSIASKFNTVILEDLNIVAMSKNRKLSKHILDAGWGFFRQALEYKTNVIAIDPRYTSQICSHCGEKDKKSRISQAEFICTSCGAKSNADYNAAKNILDQGMIIIRQRKARAYA